MLALWGFFTGLRFFRFLGFSLILIPNCSGGLGADIPDTAFIGFQVPLEPECLIGIVSCDG